MLNLETIVFNMFFYCWWNWKRWKRNQLFIFLYTQTSPMMDWTFLTKTSSIMLITVIFWTEISCWCKSCSNKATLFLCWSHRYKNSTVVITIWSTMTMVLLLFT